MAQNWENAHLRYTHGYGAVVTPAAQDAEGPMQWWLQNLNLHSEVGFEIEKPDIYYGLEDLVYAIVPNSLTIPGISGYDPESSEGYIAQKGIPSSSLLRRLVFALYFNDEKIFFTLSMGENSRMLMRRNIVERIKTLTPYLSLDADPYIVLTREKIYWIQDAYTTSPWYPVSEYSTFTFNGDNRETRFNYIRNSVKVVVDAYDGSVDYYIATKDPIIQAYARMYPGVFKDLSEMPPALQQQIRYPQDIFSIQMQIYSKYHQTDPALFYQQADTWAFSTFHHNRLEPYYLTIGLGPCKDVRNFVLISPMTPINRTNLSALAIGGVFNYDECTQNYQGQLVVYRFEKAVQVDGPEQIDALINQDAEIAQEIALWDLRGSRVQKGSIIIVPVGRSVVYVQPIYLVSATATKIPELRRVILSLGRFIVMETSLEKAFTKLERRLMAAKEPAAQAPRDQGKTPNAKK